MRVIIGTYRGRVYVERLLDSLHEHVSGVGDIVFVDDSGDELTRRWLRRHGDVVPLNRDGYNAAMKVVCETAGDDRFFFVEEDFTFLADVDLVAMEVALIERPYLAQLALLRGPWFPVEHEHGGLIEALKHKGHQFDVVDGVLEHTAIFTCNPAVWQSGIAARGWPDGKWSEDTKTEQLVAEGFRFGYLPGVRVEHDGKRSGHGY